MPIVTNRPKRPVAVKQEFPKEVPPAPPPAPVVVQSVDPSMLRETLQSVERVVALNEKLVASIKTTIAPPGKKVIVADIERDSVGRLTRIRMEVE